MKTYEYLSSLMNRYKTDSLAGISSSAFKAQIDDYLAMVDAEMEGFTDPSVQRDLSINFTGATITISATSKLKDEWQIGTSACLQSSWTSSRPSRAI